MSIQSGDHPRIIEHKLSVFLAPDQRPTAPPAAAPPPRPELPVDAAEDGDEFSRYVDEHGARIVEVVRQVAAAEVSDASQRATLDRLAGEAARGDLPLTSLLGATVHAGILAQVIAALKGEAGASAGQVSLPATPSFGFDDIASLPESEIRALLRGVDQRDLARCRPASSPSCSTWRPRGRSPCRRPVTKAQPDTRPKAGDSRPCPSCSTALAARSPPR